MRSFSLRISTASMPTKRSGGIIKPCGVTFATIIKSVSFSVRALASLIQVTSGGDIGKWNLSEVAIQACRSGPAQERDQSRIAEAVDQFLTNGGVAQRHLHHLQEHIRDVHHAPEHRRVPSHRR